MAIAVVAAAVAVAATLAQRSRRPRGPPARATGDTVPRYAGDSLIRPDGFERWVLAGASMGLGYSQPSGADAAAGATAGMFHNVYIEPSAYEHYVRTGKFREKTMMAMTLYEPGQKVHPSKQGFFEGDFIAVEVSLKDSERYPGSWAYFNFGKGATGLPRRRDAAAGVPVVPRQERGRRQRLRAVLSHAPRGERQVRPRQDPRRKGLVGRRDGGPAMTAVDRRAFLGTTVGAAVGCGAHVLAALAGRDHRHAAALRRGAARRPGAARALGPARARGGRGMDADLDSARRRPCDRHADVLQRRPGGRAGTACWRSRDSPARRARAGSRERHGASPADGRRTSC